MIFEALKTDEVGCVGKVCPLTLQSMSTYFGKEVDLLCYFMLFVDEIGWSKTVYIYSLHGYYCINIRVFCIIIRLLFFHTGKLKAGVLSESVN